jgi:superfamily II DNA or RNA helicase
MIQIASNATDARLLNAPKDALLEVHRLLSYKVQGSEHMAAFQSGNWGGRSSFFNFDKAHFPAGFVDLVARGLRKLGHEVQLLAKPRPEPLGPERPVVSAFGYSERYDYQPLTVDKLIQHGKMVAQVATGGGKSIIARIAYKRIDRPTLFLTTRGILMHQMRKAVVEEMREEVAVLGDGEWGIPYTRPDGTKGRRLTKFCVGMVQTLSQRLEVMTVEGELLALNQRRAAAVAKAVQAARAKLQKDGMLPHLIGQEVNRVVATMGARLPSPKLDRSQIETKVAKHERIREGTLKFLERFELVIAEEAHELSGTGFYTVMAACKNAHYRLALTATPFMKDDEEANMRLLAACGPVAIKISEQMLIERGILAKPYFKFLKLDEARKPKSLFRSTPWQKAYATGIVTNEYRNKLMCAEVLRAMRYGLNAMMLVQYKAHGEILRAMLTAAGARADFIDGDSSQEERQDCLNRLGRGDLDVLIGSTILDVGVDVPSIGMIVLAGGGKAEVALRQRIGRGLREKKRGPNVALIVDVYDEFNNHTKGHSAERQAIIKATPGFAENIVRDFDYVALGFDKRAA